MELKIIFSPSYPMTWMGFMLDQQTQYRRFTDERTDGINKCVSITYIRPLGSSRRFYRESVAAPTTQAYVLRGPRAPPPSGTRSSCRE